MLSRVLMLAAAALLAAASPVEGQAPDLQAVGQAGRLRVYLDCNHICFEDYLRDEITFVDFVRQPQDADVHVLAVSNETGGGGREIVLRFVGRERFAGHDEELRAITLSGDTEATRRELVLRTVEVALLAFMARDGFPSGVLVEVDTPGGSGGGAQAGDPWSGWVFSVRTSADYSAEESTTDRSWDLNLGANRVTDAWKLTFGTSFDYSTEEFDLDEGDPLKAVRRERQTDWFVARSWGPHWSVGLDGQFRSSTFGNTKFSFETAPAIEYSVFPYRAVRDAPAAPAGTHWVWRMPSTTRSRSSTSSTRPTRSRRRLPRSNVRRRGGPSKPAWSSRSTCTMPPSTAWR